MTGRTELMIGDFARRSRLPESTLRYYDKIGLLVPAVVDPGTGYRRYTVDQLPVAVLISRLRSLGVAPDAIADVLLGGAEAATALARERQRACAQIERGRERLRGLDELLAEGPPRAYRARIVDLAPCEVAALRFSLPAAELEAGVTRAIATLRSALRRGGQPRAGPWGAAFPLDITDQVSGFVFATVAEGFPDPAGTERLPGGRAISVLHPGSPAGLPLAYSAAFDTLGRLGAAPVGPVIEKYKPSLVEVVVPFRQLAPPR